MSDEAWPELEEDFRTWSGGFEPESEHQITVYVDYANPFGEAERVRKFLEKWRQHDEGAS